MEQDNFFSGNSDLQFVLDHFIDWARLVPSWEEDYADRAGQAATTEAPSNLAEALAHYQKLHTSYGAITAQNVAPLATAMNQIGLSFKDGRVRFPAEARQLIDMLANKGLLGYAVERRYGGDHLPLTAQAPIFEMLYRADLAFGITASCFNFAEIINRYGSEELKSSYIPKMVAGRMTGAMALTEPDYGSDLSNIRTRATKQPDGSYRINGTKRFITCGCGIEERPAAILTLARSSGPGARGLSFFLVESTNVEVAGIEKKLGLHASPTCELVFDNTPGILIGEEGKGLVKYALGLMNYARINVALQAIGLAEATVARTRAAIEHQNASQMAAVEVASRAKLSEMCATVQALRSLVYRTSEIVDMYSARVGLLTKEGLDERAIRKDPIALKWDKLARTLTPCCKFFASERANAIASDALNISGMDGVIEDSDMARILRDVRITTIYEGTSQLMVVAAIGGIVEGLRPNAVLYEYLALQVAAIQNPEWRGSLEELLGMLNDCIQIFRDKPREVKDYIAEEVVYYFSYFFALLLLCLQAQVAPPPYQAMKERALIDFYPLVQKEITRCDVRIRRTEA